MPFIQLPRCHAGAREDPLRVLIACRSGCVDSRHQVLCAAYVSRQYSPNSSTIGRPKSPLGSSRLAPPVAAWRGETDVAE